MYRFLYNFLAIPAMRSALELVRPFHHKVKAGAAGRKGLTDSVSAWRSDNPGPLAVIHSASAGQFEDAIPIFEAF
ncbi:MAG: hypothetical protein H8E46_11320 [FCB group bacterium]|nr:hypothetical protein [FCB group bacterium]